MSSERATWADLTWKTVGSPDRYTYLITLWAFAKLADLWATQYALARGAREVGPLMGAIYERFGFVGLVVIGLIFVNVLLFFLVSNTCYHLMASPPKPFSKLKSQRITTAVMVGFSLYFFLLAGINYLNVNGNEAFDSPSEYLRFAHIATLVFTLILVAIAYFLPEKKKQSE